MRGLQARPEQRLSTAAPLGVISGEESVGLVFLIQVSRTVVQKKDSKAATNVVTVCDAQENQASQNDTLDSFSLYSFT